MDRLDIEGPERRIALTAAIRAETGIDEAMIEAVVRAFYGRVRTDDVLAPVFAARVHDWEAHTARLCRFWESVALMAGTYHGQPMRAHADLPVEGAHFTRWLALFARTVEERCPPRAAAHLLERARRIAESLQVGIKVRRGELPGPAQGS